MPSQRVMVRGRSVSSVRLLWSRTFERQLADRALIADLHGCWARGVRRSGKSHRSVEFWEMVQRDLGHRTVRPEESGKEENGNGKSGNATSDSGESDNEQLGSIEPGGAKSSGTCSLVTWSPAATNPPMSNFEAKDRSTWCLATRSLATWSPAARIASRMATRSLATRSWAAQSPAMRRDLAHRFV